MHYDYFIALTQSDVIELYTLWVISVLWHSSEVPNLNMEAIAKHDFNATADDELSFKKNQVLKVSHLTIMYLNHG